MIFHFFKHPTILLFMSYSKSSIFTFNHNFPLFLIKFIFALPKSLSFTICKFNCYYCLVRNSDNKFVKAKPLNSNASKEEPHIHVKIEIKIAKSMNKSKDLNQKILDLILDLFSRVAKSWKVHPKVIKEKSSDSSIPDWDCDVSETNKQENRWLYCRKSKNFKQQ